MKKKKSFRILIIILVAAIVLLSLIGVFAMKRKMIVGKNISTEDITEFYFTYSSSTNPPEYQRYHFYKTGTWCFYHEKREGNHWPLTEQDITEAGSIELDDEQTERFFGYLTGGSVTKRRDDASAGSRGPFLYLYWEGDKGKYQVFEFASLAARGEFESFCEDLTQASGAVGSEDKTGPRAALRVTSAFRQTDLPHDPADEPDPMVMQTVVCVGDTISDFVVTAITEDSITIAAADDMSYYAYRYKGSELIDSPGEASEFTIYTGETLSASLMYLMDADYKVTITLDAILD